jgi:hypothetical protein
MIDRRRFFLIHFLREIRRNNSGVFRLIYVSFSQISTKNKKILKSNNNFISLFYILHANEFIHMHYK